MNYKYKLFYSEISAILEPKEKVIWDKTCNALVGKSNQCNDQVYLNIKNANFWITLVLVDLLEITIPNCGFYSLQQQYPISYPHFPI